MSNPEIGLSMLFCLNKTFESVLKILTNLDVKHVELVDEGLHALTNRRTKNLKEIANTYDLEFVVHAPWAGINIATPDPILRKATLKRLEKSIISAGMLNCHLWIFHPGSRTGLSQFYPGKDWQQNLSSVHKLMGIAEREGVNIAIENTPEPFPSLMKSVDDFQRFFKDLNANVGIVLDIAHANLNNQISLFLKQFTKNIIHIHVSDNDGNNDLHLGIGNGSIAWKKVANLVREIDYNNLVIIESTDHINESLHFLQKIFGLIV
ncbi:sugar phosphate isomerase/epimerase [Candidatus Bathyarchaeota archaeon]|nr:sugar phosphate isomerase/epimerase [Candidatus Bathyarchaeota archaeon]